MLSWIRNSGIILLFFILLVLNFFITGLDSIFSLFEENLNNCSVLTDKYFNSKIKYTHERCSNHPHQIHLEILSEQGIIGYLIIIFTIFHILFNSFIVYKKTGNIMKKLKVLKKI